MIDEKSSEFNVVTNAEPQPPVNVGAGATKKCARCSTELREDQLFCPHCGQKNDLQISEDVSNAIALFNQAIVDKSENKKKRSKRLIVLLGIIGVILVGVIGVSSFFSGRVDSIITELNSSSPSAATIEADYDALTPLGRLFYRSKLLTVFVDEVKSNKYTSSSGWLVNESDIALYKTYKKIAQILELDENDNLMLYIDAVLSLEQYTKYNDVRKCVSNSAGKYSTCLNYISNASKSSYYYTIKLYISYAETYAQSALTSAKTYSSGDDLCTKYIDALGELKNGLNALYYGYSSSSDVSSAISTISNIVSEISDAENSVDNIVDSMPSLY